MFYRRSDGVDYAPAFTRAAATARVDRRGIACMFAKRYRFLTSVEIWPEADGWVPPIAGNGCIWQIGDDVPLAAHEAGGLRYRGRKSGALANPVGAQICDVLIDAQNIEFSSGAYSIFMENASGWYFGRVHGKNYKQGYHILNFRYGDGGAVGTTSGLVEQCVVTGHVLANITEKTWYPYSDTCDLTCHKPGFVAAPGEFVGVAVAQAGNTLAGLSRFGVLRVFENATGAAATVPVNPTADTMAAAGFTDRGASKEWQGVSLSAILYFYYSSGGTVVANAINRSTGNAVYDSTFTGGRYSTYVSGCDDPRIVRVRALGSTRGIAAEWCATNGITDSCQVKETLSSAYLLGYGCSGWQVDRNYAEVSTRWAGEALFNFQLGSGNLRGRGNRTKTAAGVVGSYHVNIFIDMQNVDFECDMEGDCYKAYWHVASATRQETAGQPPEFNRAGVPGVATPTSDITLRGKIKTVTNKSSGSGAMPSYFALIQAADLVAGEVALTRINLYGIDASSNSIRPARYIAMYEGADATRQINLCRFHDVRLPLEPVPATAAQRFVLPRGWKHFSDVRNVTNLDDNIERTVPNVATPDLTYGKLWFDTGTVALQGITGGGFEGREIVVRGNGSRAWSTIGSAAARDGLRVTNSPITPSNVQRMRFTYTVNGWIGGLS